MYVTRISTGLIWVAKGHLDGLQKAEIVNKSKFLVQSSLKHITEWITGNRFYHRGGRYRQVSLYLIL